MKTELILTYENDPQQIMHVNLSNDLNRELIDVIDDINDTMICNSDIRKVSVCFLDVNSYEQMNGCKLTKSALKKSKFYFDDWGYLVK
jgi:hypothetical protein